MCFPFFFNQIQLILRWYSESEQGQVTRGTRGGCTLAKRWRWPCCFPYSLRAIVLVWQTAPVGCVVGTDRKQLWGAGESWPGLWGDNRYPKGSSRKRQSYSRLSSVRAQPGRCGRKEEWATPLCPTAHIHKPQLSLTMRHVQVNSGFISEGLQ